MFQSYAKVGKKKILVLSVFFFFDILFFIIYYLTTLFEAFYSAVLTVSHAGYKQHWHAQNVN